MGPRDGILTHVVTGQHPTRGPVGLRSATEQDLPSVVDLTTAFYREDGFAIIPRATLDSRLVADAVQWARDNSAAILDVVIAPNGRDVTHLGRYYASLGFVDERRRLVHLDL
jgi:hypothetical protein